MKRGHVQILSEFIEGLNDATGAASACIHLFNNPKWMAIRDMLHTIRDGCVAVATSSQVE